MEKFHLTIYSSALLLLLVVQYSESCLSPNDDCNEVLNLKDMGSLFSADNNLADFKSGTFACQLVEINQKLYRDFLKVADELCPSSSVTQNPTTQNTTPGVTTPAQEPDKDPKFIGYKSLEPLNEKICQFSIDMQKDSDPLPLLLTPDGTSDFIYPGVRSHVVELEKSKSIRLACPGLNNFITILSPEKSPPVAEIIAECQGNNLFTYEGKSFSIDNITCHIPPVSVHHRTDIVCLRQRRFNTGVFVHIGFQLNSKDFVKAIDVCQDDTKNTTYWTRFVIPVRTSAEQVCEYHEIIETSIVYGFFNNTAGPYNIDKQWETVKNLTKSEKLANEYINSADNLYIAPGQLAANRSFVYHSEHMTTYWYMNRAPQWNSFQTGNWQTLEICLKEFLLQQTERLDIYTGTYGQMSFPRKDSEITGTPLRLFNDDSQENALSVPKYFWKIVHNPQKQTAVVFVGVNDPWATTTDIEDLEEACELIKKPDWLKWDLKNSKLGLSYVCKLDKCFRHFIPILPELLVKGNLF